MGDFILGYLLNAAWQAPLIVAGAFLLLRFARLDARERCWIGIGCLALAVTLPALDPRLAPSLMPPALPEAVTYAVAPPLPAQPPGAALADDAPVPAAVLSPGPAQTQVQTLAASPAAPAPAAVIVAPLVGRVLVWLFLASVFLGAGRLILGLVAARRLTRTAQPIALPASVLAPMKRLAVTQGRKPPSVRVSTDLTVPAAVGGGSPMILVPPDFERHGEEAMVAALLHECAHVVRGDFGLNLACEALALPLIWHPAVHLIKSWVQADREAACDRLASTQMPAKRYASCLVALADALSAAPRLATPVMQTLFGRGELERRVKALLQAPLGQPRERLLRALIVGGPALCAVIALGLVLHVEPAMAQPAPPPPIPAAPASPARKAIPTAPPTPPAPPAPPALAAPNEEADTAPPQNPRIHQHSVRRWTSDDGKTHLVISDDDHELSADERARLNAEVAAARAEADRARAYVHSPAFRAKIRAAEEAASAPAIAEAKAQAAKAEAYVHGAEFQRKLAEIREGQRVIVLKRGEVIAQLERVKQILRDPEVEKALRQANDAGPEVRRALDELDREIETAGARIPPVPPVPPAPPAPPPPYDR